MRNTKITVATSPKNTLLGTSIKAEMILLLILWPSSVLGLSSITQNHGSVGSRIPINLVGKNALRLSYRRGNEDQMDHSQTRPVLLQDKLAIFWNQVFPSPTIKDEQQRKVDQYLEFLDKRYNRIHTPQSTVPTQYKKHFSPRIRFINSINDDKQSQQFEEDHDEQLPRTLGQERSLKTSPLSRGTNTQANVVSSRNGASIKNNSRQKQRKELSQSFLFARIVHNVITKLHRIPRHTVYLAQAILRVGTSKATVTLSAAVLSLTFLTSQPFLAAGILLSLTKNS
eukprot:CAMPEP_0202446128 /NCGR_PEP_ID=MMETSP1360-20130828/4742_1 /ASSEMBLY_ACC=CAM_ASM_000848 /TAXON_ID=515479 /ORGANISM="Licmophora paradoxa, Strain CCMP2313" /LENGTH=283 /DNA_ID=CAMNT_0049062563 /DNA_START=53 /DNA_END=904 /DNA_ORIENTATION=+